MTTRQDLMLIAKRERIPIMNISCKNCGSISLLDGDNCYIGIDKDTAEKLYKERCAHELGHCIKGAFYNRFSSFDIISRHEARADKWAIETLITKEELTEAIKENLDSIYLLAEHFNVSEDFMVKVCKHYGCYNEG